jgi:hypothetical protein
VLGVATFRLQQHFAPVLLLPLASGALLGLIAFQLWHGAAAAPLRAVACVLLAASLTLAAAEHLAAWRHYVRAIEQSRREHPELEWIEAASGKVPTASFTDYLNLEARHGRQLGPVLLTAGWTWASWCLDAIVPWPMAVMMFRFLGRRSHRAPVVGRQP